MRFGALAETENAMWWNFIWLIEVGNREWALIEPVPDVFWCFGRNWKCCVVKFYLAHWSWKPWMSAYWACPIRSFVSQTRDRFQPFNALCWCFGRHWKCGVKYLVWCENSRLLDCCNRLVSERVLTKPNGAICSRFQLVTIVLRRQMGRLEPIIPAALCLTS